jgi:hypothetical protein
VRLTFKTRFQNGNTAGRIAAAVVTVMMFTDLGFAAAPKLTPSPKSGPPTSSISVSGTGFSAYAAIDIYFDTTDETLAFANGSGAFSKIPIPVPASALPGNHYVTASSVPTGRARRPCSWCKPIGLSLGSRARTNAATLTRMCSI